MTENNKVKMTSACANKMLKQLAEDKEYWVYKESSSNTYRALTGETPVIPDYDYREVAERIDALDEKMCRIKHAINLANVNNSVTVNKKSMTVDTILVKMAQLNRRRDILNHMRRQQPKLRVSSGGYGNNLLPEYQYINYDIETVKADFERIDKEIMEMQMALDKYNQTVEFEVEL